MTKRSLLLSFLFIFMVSGNLLAQIKAVTGKVTDSKGSPIPGANIQIKNTKKGTTTDFDGKFKLDAKKGDVLLFTYTGFSPMEKTVNNEENLNVSLQDDTQQLNEVVVVGYGTMRKKDLTGAISSFKPTSDQAAIATSVDDLLQGKVAGVTVSTGGSTPGAAGSITIRGANSLNGDSQPLYVIDNVPQPSTGQTMRNSTGDYQPTLDPLAGINPNDIDDIQILKDASATAIYGSRGANGVIIITTKRGKAGKTTIRANAIFSVAEASKYLDLMNLREYAQYWNTKYPSDQRFLIGDQIKYVYTGVDENGQNVSKENVLTNMDWQREVTRTALSQEYNLNINGGSEKTKYSFSASFKDMEGIVKNTGLKHGDFRLNLNTNITSKLSLGYQFSGFLRKNNMTSGGNSVGRISGALLSTAINSAPYTRPTDDITFANDVDTRATVLSWLTDYDDITDEYRFSVAANLDYKISNAFKYTFRTGGNLNNVEKTNWYDTGLYNGFLYNGYLTQDRLERNNYNVENLLFFNKSVGIINIDATAGITYDAYQFLNTGAIGKGFTYKNLRTDGMHTASSIQVLTPIQSDYQLLSYLGRVNASFYDGKYVLTATMRADGTSKFSSKNKWGYFPSFALAWNLTQENFLAKTSKWLSQFKLRAGYGETGSQNVNPYSTIFGYGSVSSGYATGSGSIIQGLGVTGITNPDLKWESTESLNAGVDFGFFDSRISGAVDVYNKTTKDLLVSITIPGSTAYTSLIVNRGEIRNKGIETTLNLDIIRKKDLKWTIGGNIAFNKSTINKIGNTPGEYGSLGTITAFLGNTAGDHFGAANIFIEGQAPGLFYGFKTDGIVQQGDTYTVGAPFGNSAAPGNLKVVDANGDGVVNLSDKTIIGDPNPDYTYGFQTSLKYKQLRFSTSFTGVKGGDILNSNNRYTNLANFQSGDRNMNPAAIANAWTVDNPSNVYPSITSNIVTGHIYDRYLEDGSYLRCNDITLGYTFGQDIVGKMGLSSLDLFASAKNPFTLTNYSGYDPASRSFNFDPLRRGFDLYSFPVQRQIILGLNLTF
ncbi:TonB-dependent receptor [uncultured Flavobacterium sp.]|uniref:SusC/RagA family TonB-linked outer membrane protein n=1 Tax=uncultured Flavobacterium sp. TaxID=165435 RepID=UPI0025F36468|nr:TonB-dependent receptor [uncultured Flavobacterium sp.]